MKEPIKDHFQHDSCWREIGVWSEQRPSCPRLPAVVHCRNCETFIRAGRELLERPAPPGYRQEWTVDLAEPKDLGHKDQLSAVLFRLGAEWLGLSTRVFVEITGLAPIHKVPHRSNELLLGLVNVHGDLLLGASLRHLLEIEAGPDRQAAREGAHPGVLLFPRMIVVAQGSDRWVFPVDEIADFCRYDTAALRPPPATLAKGPAEFIRGVLPQNGRNLGLLDEERLFSALNRRMT